MEGFGRASGTFCRSHPMMGANGAMKDAVLLMKEANALQTGSGAAQWPNRYLTDAMRSATAAGALYLLPLLHLSEPPPHLRKSGS